MTNSTVNRRVFIHGAMSSVTAAAIKPTFGSPLDIRPRCLEEFGYQEVCLGASLQQSQLESTVGVIVRLDDDSLLEPYRRRAGLPAPGCSLGGWYSEAVVGAETFGQWISALSRYYAISGDEACRAKVARLLNGFARTVEPSGRIFGDPKVTTGTAYHYDKLTCGLMDAHQFARYPGALELIAKVTDAAIPQLPGKAVDALADNTLGAHESYTISENQFIVWQRSGVSRHLQLAQDYLYHSFFDPLSRGENVLAGRHAYSHVNALCSAAKAYMVLGDERYLAAARNGFAFVQLQSFATGGWGPNEAFVPSPAAPEFAKLEIRTLADSLTRTHRSFETPCGAYAHFKLTRYLLRITGDSSYGDSMERVMYNTVLGATALQQDGRAFYYSDYNVDGRKGYFDGFGQIKVEWPCCSGTLPQVAADYRISTYFQDSNGVYVNLYIPSTLRWRHSGIDVALHQRSAYPLSDVVTLDLELTRSAEFSLSLRIPRWAQQVSVYLNGRRLPGSVQSGTFKTIKRTWHSKDRVEIELPKRIELVPIDDAHPNIVAVTYGPLVLFAVCDEIPHLTRRQLLSARRRSLSKPEWVVEGDSTLRLIPFWVLANERYSTYLTVS